MLPRGRDFRFLCDSNSVLSGELRTLLAQSYYLDCVVTPAERHSCTWRVIAQRSGLEGSRRREVLAEAGVGAVAILAPADNRNSFS